MASSYTTNFGIEEMAAGDQTGTWGDTTNFNFDILDRIAAYKAVALSDAATATLTVREASPGSGTENLQDGMFRVIKFTGSLSQNCTITIAPNTTAAWFIFENATTDAGSSGPYSLIFSQGSGANVTLQNGKNAIVYCDGAGAGAVVTDALADLQVGTLEVTGVAAIDGNVTIAGDLTISGDDLVMGTNTSGAALIADGTNFNPVVISGDAAIGTDGALTIADNAVTLAKMAGLARGKIIYGDSSGNPAALAVGSANYILKSDGTDIAWAATAVSSYTNSGDNRVLTSVDSSTINGEANLSFDGSVLAVTGNVTATGTIEPAGDTSASDNAAIGYTSAEGLILTGQGSTNDVTIKNDADADVLTIPTGTTNISVAGNVSLSDASSVDISTPLLAGADHTYSGLTAQMLAGGAISAFDLVCIHTTTSEVVEADASAYSTARVIGIAPAAISDTATGTILLHGFIRDDSWNWTTGSTLYVSETAGAMTHTAPSTDGAFVVVVGVALSPDVVYINPSMDVIEHA
jgi:hypothetical protein